MRKLSTDQFYKVIERQKNIRNFIEDGHSFQEAALFFKLSRQRIHQIYYHKYSDIHGDPLQQKFPSLRGRTGREYTRELVRIRDNHTCQLCKKVWEVGTRRFDVHHLSDDPKDTRGYDQVADMDHMQTLCHKCHLNLDSTKSHMRKTYRLRKEINK